MIAARRLIRKFGDFPAVDSIDFDIPRGQVVGFLGPNGAGKTTTIRMICGYLRPTAGRVTIDGLDVWAERRAVQRRLGYLPELAPLYSEMRVCEYVRFRARLAGVGRARRKSSVEHALARCWLSDVARRPIGHLSRGFRQRVGLAAALVAEPPVLILDEPTAGLDPTQIRAVRGLIRELAGKHTVLLSTHILGEVEKTCDRVLMIAGGRIRFSGTIDEIRTAAEGDRRYIIETDSISCVKGLAALPGVAKVHGAGIDDRWQRITVTAAAKAGDLRESISKSLQEAGGVARELFREAASLERLFIRMVDEAESDGNDTSNPGKRGEADG